MVCYGYHYTSLDNWEKIKTEGLVPQLMSQYVPQAPWREELFKELHPLYGVWVWASRSEKHSHIGNILFQSRTKGAKDIAHLRVSFPSWPDPDVLTFDDKILVIGHTGLMGDWKYHEGEVGFIITKPIPTSRIELLDVYNLPKLVHEEWYM